jgi:hypothetical protein
MTTYLRDTNVCLALINGHRPGLWRHHRGEGVLGGGLGS